MSDGVFFRTTLLIFIGVWIGYGIYVAGQSSGAATQKTIDDLERENSRLTHVRIFQFCPGENDNPPAPEEKKEQLLKL